MPRSPGNTDAPLPLGMHFLPAERSASVSGAVTVYDQRGRWQSPKKLHQKTLPPKRDKSNDLPGPAHYAAPKIQGPSGGKFNASNPKSDIEWRMYRASQLPAPGDYGAPALPKPSGGRFSTAFPKSELEWVIYRAKDKPGPAVYPAPKLSKPSGGRFNESRPKTELEWVQYRAARLPAPGDYDTNRGVLKLSTTKPSPAFSLRGKVVKGNSQTTLPDAVGYRAVTANPDGPARCRTDSFLDARQMNSRYKRPPGVTLAAGGRLDRIPGTHAANRPQTMASKLPKHLPAGQRAPYSVASDYERYFGYRPKGTRGDAHAKRRTAKPAARKRKGKRRTKRKPKKTGQKTHLPSSPHDPPGVGSYFVDADVPVRGARAAPSFSFGYGERPALAFK